MDRECGWRVRHLLVVSLELVTMAHDIASDPRFRHVLTDPRFKVRGHSYMYYSLVVSIVCSRCPQTIPQRSRKVRIGSRFQSMFTDHKFKVKCEDLIIEYSRPAICRAAISRITDS